jgi:hypothetical protein
MTTTTNTNTSRVFLSNEAGLQIVGFGINREAAVRNGLNILQVIYGDVVDYSEFRTFDVFPAWQLNPHVFYGVECNHPDIDDEGHQIRSEERPRRQPLRPTLTRSISSS